MDLDMGKYLLSSFVYGLNSGDEHDEHSFLLESDLMSAKSNVYGRIEYIQKSAEELAIISDGADLFNISAFTLGAAYRLASFGKIDLYAGIQGTVNATGKMLESLYGSTPLSGEVYLRFSPSLMKG